MTTNQYLCMGCKTVSPVSQYLDNAYRGWKADGTLVRAENRCCPHCGSNDLAYFGDNHENAVR